MEFTFPQHPVIKISAMKKNLTLTIAQPCSENWDAFTPAANGRFCGSCSKVVVDFTKMSDIEIVDFFTNKPAHTCGRFHPDQLKTYSYNTAPHIVKPGFTWLKAGLLSLIFVVAGKQGSAQTAAPKTASAVAQYPRQHTGQEALTKRAQTIRGKVLSDEDNSPLPGVNVLLKGSEVGTITDVNGQFEFPQSLKEGDVLVFAFIGLQTREYTVSKDAPAGIEIRMAQDIMELMGAVADDDVYADEHSRLHTWWLKIKNIFS